MGMEATDTVMAGVMVIVMAEVITMDTVMGVKVIRTEMPTWKVGIIYQKTGGLTACIHVLIYIYMNIEVDLIFLSPACKFRCVSGKVVHVFG